MPTLQDAKLIRENMDKTQPMYAYNDFFGVDAYVNPNPSNPEERFIVVETMDAKEQDFFFESKLDTEKGWVLRV